MQITRTVVYLRYFVAFSMIAVLFGCGFVDNAGDGENNPPAVIGGDIQADEGETVLLTSSVVDDFDNVAKYEWTQVEDEAPRVEIMNADQAQASFVAPAVKVPESPLEFEFKLTVTDNFGELGQGNVNVDVNAVNELPEAQDDEGVTDEGLGVTINVVENDSDSDGTLDPTTVEITSQAFGTAEAKDDGSVTFTHDGSEPNTNAFNGLPNTAGFTYTVRDDETSASVPASVAIAVNPVNDAPTANDDNAGTNEDTQLAIAILDNDTDPDSAIDPGEVKIKKSPKKAKIAINQGVITYIPRPNLNGSDSFTYTVKDVEGLESEVATVNVDIIPVNDPPNAKNDSFSVDEDTQNNSLNLVKNDSDVEGGLVVDSLTILSGPTKGKLAGPPVNGIVRYTPNANFRGTDNLTYQVADEEGLTDTATVTIRVKAVNDPPTISNIPDQVTAEDTPVGPISFIIGDASDETPVTQLILSKNSSNPSLVPTNNIEFGGSGATRTVKVTPAKDQNGVATITVTVRDRGDGDDGPKSASDTFRVTVTAVNDPPVANNDSAVTDENQAVSISLLDNDVDVEGQGGRPSSVRIVTLPNNGRLSQPTNGRVVYTPNDRFNGTDAFTYKAIDSNGVESANAATVTVTVNSVNEPPVAADDFNDQAIVNLPIGIDVLQNDRDPDGTLVPSTVTVTVLPQKGTTNVIGSGRIVYTPGEIGTDTFKYTVQDNEGATSNEATVTVSVTVSGGGEVDDFALQSLSSGAESGCWSTPQEKRLIGSLDNGSAAKLSTYRIVANASKGWVSMVDPTTGRFEYVPNRPGVRGVDTFAYEVNDPEAGATMKTAQIVITPTVMPLGGAVTAGLVDGAQGLPAQSERIGYRSALYDDLRARGYPIDLVGTQGGAAVAGFDSDHEGHPGWTAAELAYGRVSDGSDGIYAWLEANPADVILLHAGTHGLNTSPAQIAEILDEVERWERSARGNPVTVLVARVIDQNPSNPDVQAFNDNVAAMVRERVENPADPAYPDKLLMVDQQAALSYPDDLFDAEHPDAAGYDKMATQWRDALLRNKLLQKCP